MISKGFGYDMLMSTYQIHYSQEILTEKVQRKKFGEILCGHILCILMK